MIFQNARDIFNVDITMLSSSSRDHAIKLIFNTYVHLPSINKMFQYRYASVILGGLGEVIIFEHGCFVSALAHIRMLILNICVFLECINTIYKYGHAWMI